MCSFLSPIIFINFSEQASADSRDQHSSVITPVQDWEGGAVELLRSLTCFKDSNPLFDAARHKFILEEELEERKTP